MVFNFKFVRMFRLLFLVILFSSLEVMAQTSAVVSELPSPDGQSETGNMALWEDSLISSLSKIDTELNGATRKELAKKFVPQLVKALKTPSSFTYKFSKIDNISILYPADSSFRIFSWVIPTHDKKSTDTYGLPSADINEKLSYDYYGAIQMKADTLRLFPLIDQSSKFISPEDSVLTNKSWYGCVYYKLVTKNLDDLTFYTLLGWNGADGRSTRKLADVLYFKEGNPYFGAPVFQVKRDETKKKVMRFIHEFKADAGVSLNYDPKIDAIVFDYIKPQTEESKGAFGTYIPDGTVDGMKYKDGLWTFIPLIYESLGMKNTDPARQTQTGGTNTKRNAEKPLYTPAKKSKTSDKKKKK